MHAGDINCATHKSLPNAISRELRAGLPRSKNGGCGLVREEAELARSERDSNRKVNPNGGDAARFSWLFFGSHKTLPPKIVRKIRTRLGVNRFRQFPRLCVGPVWPGCDQSRARSPRPEPRGRPDDRLRLDRWHEKCLCGGRGPRWRNGRGGWRE